MRILLAVSNNLENDQRVNKVATSLFEMGHEVKVLGVKKPTWTHYEKEYETARFSVWFKKSILFYIEYTVRLFLHLLFEKCDVIWANDTDTIMPCVLVGRMRGKQVVSDSHELFPEVPEVTDRKTVKAVWTKIEDWFLPKADANITVCQSIADYYNNKYKVPFHVVRNIPFYKEYEGRREANDLYPQIPRGKRIILYQGAVNVGRGIEWIIDAMPLVNEDAIFVIAGEGDLYEELKKKASDRIIFLGHIPYQKLRDLTLCADMGVCLLEAKGLSYYYALPNRVFDLISAHVPILATDFPEIRRVVEKYESGELISQHEPEYLAGVINGMLSKEIDHEKFAKAAEELCWNREQKVLEEVIMGLKIK